MQIGATYISQFGNEPPGAFLQPAALALGVVYRSPDLSPFQINAAFNWKNNKGWRINPVIYANSGYPYGGGYYTAVYCTGKPVIVPSTSLSLIYSQTPGYIDPLDPGTCTKPNIAATRGVAEPGLAGGLLTTPRVDANVTIEYKPPSRGLVQSVFGLSISQLVQRDLQRAGGQRLLRRAGHHRFDQRHGAVHVFDGAVRAARRLGALVVAVPHLPQHAADLVPLLLSGDAMKKLGTPRLAGALSTAACISLLAGCGNGGASEPPVTSYDPGSTSKLQFAVGVATIAFNNGQSVAYGVNAVETLRQKNGLSGTLYNVPMLIGPSSFNVLDVDTDRQPSAVGRRGPRHESHHVVDAEPAQWTGPPRGPKSSTSGAFGYGLCPCNSDSGPGNGFSPLYQAYNLPVYGDDEERWYGGPPAFPAGDPSVRNLGWLGYSLGFTDFAVAPVVGAYHLYAAVPPSYDTPQNPTPSPGPDGDADATSGNSRRERAADETRRRCRRLRRRRSSADGKGGGRISIDGSRRGDRGDGRGARDRRQRQRHLRAVARDR